MKKLYEVNGQRSEYPLDLPLVKEDGSLEDYYSISGEAKNKILLGDVVNGQVEIINAEVAKKLKEESKDSASSGNNAQNASSGDYAQNASSGYNAQNASSGNNARNASSGNYAQNASSGNYARNASSGDYAQNASSGNHARNASSGNHARNASSGYNARNASSGYNARNASSGNHAQNETTGKNSISYHCGFKATEKAVDGTWISLAEYEKKDNHYIPCFGLTAQVGNPDYLDAWGKPLDENEHYLLYNRKFQRVTFADGIMLIKLSEKKVGPITAYKTIEPYNDESKLKYLVFDGENYSHGETLKQAKDSLVYKISNRDTSSYDSWKNSADKEVSFEEAVKGYRVITGACEAGTRAFVDKLTEKTKKLTVSEIIQLTKGEWGHDRLVEFLNQKGAAK